MSNRLEPIFDSLQKRLISGLNSSRLVLTHPVAKGDASESNWLKLLQDHLPYRYQVDQAFIVDHEGLQSEQIDIVIYDRQYTPILYNIDGQRIIPAESVYAIFEVKQDLSKEHIEYAGKKTASVRKLKRTSTSISHAGGTYKPREPIPITAGLLTYQSSWTPAFGDPFKQAIKALDKFERLDIGCSVNSGGYEVHYTNVETVTLEVSNEERSLVFFLFKLLNKLQKIGTVTAIDYEIYGSMIGSSIYALS
jgi:hypothetical protein